MHQHCTVATSANVNMHNFLTVKNARLLYYRLIKYYCDLPYLVLEEPQLVVVDVLLHLSWGHRDFLEVAALLGDGERVGGQRLGEVLEDALGVGQRVPRGPLDGDTAAGNFEVGEHGLAAVAVLTVEGVDGGVSDNVGAEVGAVVGHTRIIDGAVLVAHRADEAVGNVVHTLDFEDLVLRRQHEDIEDVILTRAAVSPVGAGRAAHGLLVDIQDHADELVTVVLVGPFLNIDHEWVGDADLDGGCADHSDQEDQEELHRDGSTKVM